VPGRNNPKASTSPRRIADAGSDKRRSQSEASSRKSLRVHRPLLIITAILLLLGATVAILIRFEKVIPPLVADRLPKAESVLVEKAERRLSLIRNGRAYRSYRVSLGREPVGHKQREGDLRTPEGRYILDWRNPDSCCYKSLHVSYPNERDVLLAGERGDDPGGLIMIHGQENGWGWLSWLAPYVYRTHGCIAVRNTPMEEIWNAVDDGTPIEISP
jgi:hypothetical protein